MRAGMTSTWTMVSSRRQPQHQRLQHRPHSGYALLTDYLLIWRWIWVVNDVTATVFWCSAGPASGQWRSFARVESDELLACRLTYDMPSYAKLVHAAGFQEGMAGMTLILAEEAKHLGGILWLACWWANRKRHQVFIHEIHLFAKT